MVYLAEPNAYTLRDLLTGAVVLSVLIAPWGLVALVVWAVTRCI